MSEQRHYADPRVGGECPRFWSTGRHSETCACLGAGRVGVRTKCRNCHNEGPPIPARNGGCDGCDGLGYIERVPEIELVQGWPLAEGEGQPEGWFWRRVGETFRGTIQGIPAWKRLDADTPEAALLAARCAWFGVSVDESGAYAGSWNVWVGDGELQSELHPTPEAALCAAIDAKGDKP